MGIFDFFKGIRKKNNKIELCDNLNTQTASKFIDNLTPSIEEISQQYFERSERLHKEHIKKVKEFDINNIIHTDLNKLNSVELSFLKYMNNRKLSFLDCMPIYWTLEYNIDYKYIFSKFFNMNYIRISNSFDMLPNLKMVDLKDILTKNNLPTNGRSKQILIDRIKDNIDMTTLDTHLEGFDRFFLLTDEGNALVEHLQKSVTMDLELEDKCIELIKNKCFSEAYKLVCKFELNKPSPRGIGVEWDDELKNGLSKNYIAYYHSIFDVDLNLDDNSIEDSIKSAYILSKMLGLGLSSSAKLATRVINNKFDKKYTTELLEEIRFQLECKRDFSDDNPNSKYEILGTLDLRSCDKCSQLDGKVFYYKNAKVGVNYPPFHRGCRCTVDPYTESSPTLMRACRNPITGKSEYTYAKDYNEWMEELYSKHGKDTIDELKLKIQSKNKHNFNTKLIEKTK